MDPNVQRIVDRHLSRAEKGMQKYGVDTTRDDLTGREWLVHLQEELMDAAVYAERLIEDMKLRANESTIKAFLRHSGKSVDEYESTEEVLREFVDFLATRGCIVEEKEECG